MENGVIDYREKSKGTRVERHEDFLIEIAREKHHVYIKGVTVITAGNLVGRLARVSTVLFVKVVPYDCDIAEVTGQA